MVFEVKYADCWPQISADHLFQWQYRMIFVWGSWNWPPMAIDSKWL